MRGATAAVFVFDITKRWTFDYVTRELSAAAATGIHCLVLANFRDMGDKRVVTRLEGEDLCKRTGENCHYLEASMRNAYGVKAVATFFNLPFLYLQRQALLAEVARNEGETTNVREELRLLGEELTYDAYMKMLADKRLAQRSPQQPPPTSPTSPPLQQPTPTPTPTPTVSAEKPEPPVRPTQPVEVPATKTEEPTAVQSAPARGDPALQQHSGGSLASLKSLLSRRPQPHEAAATAPIPPTQEAKEEDKKEKEREKKEREEQQKAKAAAEADKKAKEAAAAKAAAVAEAEKKAAAAKAAADAEKKKKQQDKEKKKKPTVVADTTPPVDTVAELKKLARQPAPQSTGAVADAGDFKPGDLDDSFWGSSGSTVADDGWMVPAAQQQQQQQQRQSGGTVAAEDDGWGATMEEAEKPAAEKPKKARRGMLLADQEEPDL